MKKEHKFLGWGASTVVLTGIAFKTFPLSIFLMTKTTILTACLLSAAYTAIPLLALQCIVWGVALSWNQLKRLAPVPTEEITLDVEPAILDIVDMPPPPSEDVDYSFSEDPELIGAMDNLLNNLANIHLQHDDNPILDNLIQNDHLIICRAPVRAARHYKTEVEKLLDAIHPDVENVAPKQIKQNPHKRISPQTYFYDFK